MARQARTHYAILGLLCWKPMSGYDIRRMVEVALQYFWNESYGQIFPTLNRLVEAGLATKRADRRSGNRGRQVYRVTAAGRRTFMEWLHEPTEMPRLRDELKLKFFLTARSTSGEALRVLEEYARQQREHLAVLRDSESILKTAYHSGTLPEELDELSKVLDWSPTGSDDQAHELLMFLLTLRSGILIAEARVAWTKEATSVLKRGRISK